MEKCGSGAILLLTPPESRRNGDAHYRYRTSSHFLYLTDHNDPRCALLLLPESGQVHLFATANTPEKALWDGPLPSFEDIAAKLGVDKVHDIAKIEDTVSELTENCPALWIELNQDKKAHELVEKLNARRQAAIRKGARPISELKDLSGPLSELRLIKDEEDLRRMRASSTLAREGHLEAMRACKPGVNEREIEALVEYSFRRLGATAPAYNSIVGTGNNACILHYIRNDATLKEGDLLLVDAGAEKDGYASDVTRTYPVSGRFSDPQRKIYEIVLDSQLKAIEACRPGTPFLEVHEIAARRLAKGLVDLGILPGPVDEAVKSDRFRKYYPHRTSHWLGLDVHDCGLYSNPDKSSRKLEPGMVLTVEPGLYFPADDTVLESAYRGIGIRIEDDILVTAKGPEVLTTGIPKTVAEIEATVGKPAVRSARA